MEKKNFCGILFFVSLILCFLLTGCGMSLPKQDQLKQDLNQYKISAGLMTSGQNIDELKNLEITSTQDNSKKDKTAIFLANAEWIDNSLEALVSAPLKISYTYYDEGGWKLEDVQVIDEKKITYKPAAPITNEKIVEIIKHRGGLPITVDEDGKYIRGTLSGNEPDLKKYTWNTQNIDDVKVTQNSYNEKNKSAAFTIIVKASNPGTDFTGTYTGTADFRHPGESSSLSSMGWDILDNSLKVTKQDINFKIPSSVKNNDLYFTDSMLWTYKLSYSLNKDSNGKFVDGSVTINGIPMLGGNKMLSSYKVSVTEDAKTGELLLTPGEWIDKSSEQKKPFTVKLYISHDTSSPDSARLTCEVITSQGSGTSLVYIK